MSAVSEFFTPTERAFKGMTIFFSIQTGMTFVALIIVSQLTSAHLRYAKDNNIKDYDPDGVVADKKFQVDTGLMVGGFFFLTMAILSFCMKIKYKGVMGRQHAGYIDANILDHVDNDNQAMYSEGGESEKKATVARIQEQFLANQ